MKGPMRKGLLTPSILFVILIVFYGAWLIVYPQNYEFIVGFGTLVGSLMLVFITMFYTLAAFSLVAETQKDREIQWIEHQLKDLYYPLARAIGESQGDPARLEAFLDHDQMAYRAYLAEPELKSAIEHFMKEWNTKRIGTPEVDTTFDTIQKLVSQDIGRLESRLAVLTKIKP